MTPPDQDPVRDDAPLDDDTLAVHAVVDDEATAEQRRRVARDPALVAQVADLRRVVARVAAPVEPPADDILAALRARALDAPDDVDADRPDAGAAPAGPAPVAPRPSPAPAPVPDLAAVRARRARRLPPLPAVAAVVVILVLVGVGLLVTGGQDDGDESAGQASADLEAEGAGGGDSAESEAGDTAGAANEAGEEATAADGAAPSDALREQLLAAAVTSYGSDDELLAELRRVDPEALDLAGAGAADQTTTTGAASTSEAEVDDRAAVAFASDPAVIRCDSVLRSAEPDLEPVTAATLVDVDGVPVLVLSNPIEPSEAAPRGLRLTVLNAIDCSPRAAVVR